jgi:hypothetical protein
MSKMSSKQRSINRRIVGVTMPITRRRIKWGRNWLCLCNSGLKYKNCCLKEMNKIRTSDGNANIMSLPDDVQDIVDKQQDKEVFVKKLDALQQVLKKTKEQGDE